MKNTLGHFSQPADGYIIFTDFNWKVLDWRQLGGALPAGSVPLVVVAGPHRLDLHAYWEPRFRGEGTGQEEKLWTIDEYAQAVEELLSE